MNKIKLTSLEKENHIVGAAITLTAVMAILVSAIVAVVVYKLFTSAKGSTSIPGGWKFSWN